MRRDGARVRFAAWAMAAAILIPGVSFSQKYLIPMDLKQANHLKAYGIAYLALTKNIEVDWLLNYRSGSFMIDGLESVGAECRVRGVTYEEITGAEAALIYSEIQAEDNNMDVVRLEKAPKIAVYVPPNTLPWDDAVTLAMEYAEIPYAKIWDDEVLRDTLAQFDWLHLHHEDFTGQYGKFYASFATTKAATGDLACTTRCQRGDQLERHVQMCHTNEGIAKRLRTEQQMADLFTKACVPFDRDAKNIVRHSSCESIKRYFRGHHSRPDFHLYSLQASASALVLVGNDEFAHRRYDCEFDRMLKIYSAIAATSEFHNVPMFYIRFNPHHYEIDGVLHDPPLVERQKKLLELIAGIDKGEITPHTPGLNVIYMFYDKDAEGNLEILKDENVDTVNKEFAMVIRECVHPVSKE